MQKFEELRDSGERLLLRGAAIVGLGGVALIHVLDLQAKFEEAPLIGVSYVILILGSLWAAAVLIRKDSRLAWIVGGGLAFLTIIGYVLSRTTGLPTASDDIGNWLEPLGAASLFVEGWTVLVTVWALWFPAMSASAAAGRTLEEATSGSGRRAA